MLADHPLKYPMNDETDLLFAECFQRVITMRLATMNMNSKLLSVTLEKRLLL